MDETLFILAHADRRDEILFNGSHMLNGFLFENNGPGVIEENPHAHARFPVLLKSLFPSLGIRTEINRVRAARGRGGEVVLLSRETETWKMDSRTHQPALRICGNE